MAKIELQTFDHLKEKPWGSKTTIEVRVWGLAGTQEQCFNLGSGSNYDGRANTWLEILYAVNGVNLLYTRNFINHYHGAVEAALERLDKFAAGESDLFGYGDMFPETSLTLKREAFTWEEETRYSYRLEISLDIGAVFNFTGPGHEFITIRLPEIPLEKGMAFMRELTLELDQANQGKHPDPGSLPVQSGEWPFALQLNRQAYDRIAAQYQEDYFRNSALSKQFEAWMERLPPGGHVLDTGCGHGDPVITRLLERGFQTTGVDLSPEMIHLAREKFPAVPFFTLAVTQLDMKAEFDGACSLSSMIYLDPVDFFQAIYRLYRAIKPGGLLFLYGYDIHPGWRGFPYNEMLDQWMWSWTRSLDEAVSALEEHGYFSVLEAVEVSPPREEEASDPAPTAAPVEEVIDLVNNLPEDAPKIKLPDLPKPKRSRAYAYAILARRNGGD